MRSTRADYEVIVGLVRAHSRVLDVGCGDGALMQMLTRECSAKPRGLEIDPNKAHRCVVSCRVPGLAPQVDGRPLPKDSVVEVAAVAEVFRSFLRYVYTEQAPERTTSGESA